MAGPTRIISRARVAADDTPNLRTLFAVGVSLRPFEALTIWHQDRLELRSVLVRFSYPTTPWILPGRLLEQLDGFSSIFAPHVRPGVAELDFC